MRNTTQLTLLLMLATSTWGSASEEPESVTLSRHVLPEKIVNGVSTVTFPSVVALISNNEEFCTGTLIGCDTVLTAAHCVCTSTGGNCQPGGPGLKSPGSIEVFAQHGGFYPVSAIAVPANYVFGSAGDIAVLTLGTTVNGISPTPINTRSSPGTGVAGTITGFGLTSGTANDNGIKRTGRITSAACSGVPESTHVCWNFALPLGAPGLDSNTCQGDSGGPLFMNLGCGNSVAGVTSGGANVNCQANDSSYDTDVYVERAWVQSQAGNDLSNTSCGSLGQAGSSEAIIHYGEGHLSGVNDQDFWSLDVSSEIAVARFVLNGEDGLGNDFDLYVKQGSQPSTSDYDCRSIRSGTYEVCEIVAPTAGTWHILVDRFSNTSGNYQIVVTPFEEKSGSVLYAVGSDVGDGSSALYRIRENGSNPTAEVIGETGVTLFDIGIDPTTSRIYGVAGGSFYELSSLTGTATFKGPTGVSDLNALEFDASGQAYAWGSSGNLYRINKATGATTLIGFTGFSSGGDLAFGRNDTLYGSTDSQLIRIDIHTGVGTLIGSLGFSGAFGLEVDTDGTTMYVGRGANGSNLAELYLVNKDTGGTALIGSVENVFVGLFGLSFLESPETSQIFEDGFESGGVCSWSSSVGAP